MGRLAEKLLNMMKFSEEDGYEEEYDQEYDDIEEEGYFYEDQEEEEPDKKSLFLLRKKKKENEEFEASEEAAEAESKVIPFHGNQQEEGEIVKVIKPQEFNEAQIVADFLKEGKTIVVNLEGIEISQAQRIIDFIGGASFAVDGSLKAISNNIFIVAPGNIEVSGDLRDEIISDSMLSPELTKF